MTRARLNPNQWRESADAARSRAEWFKQVKAAVLALEPTFPERTMEKRIRSIERVLDYVAELNVHPDDRVGGGLISVDPFDAAQIVVREGRYLREARMIFASGLRQVGVLPPLDPDATIAENHRRDELHIAGLLGVPDDEANEDVRRR